MQTKLLSLIVLTVVFAAACVNAPQTKTDQADFAPQQTANKIRIGFSMDTLKEEHWQRDKDLIESRAAELGAEVYTSVADGNDERQVNQVDNFLTRGIDVLIIAPHNAQVAASAVEKAKKQGVPVISYDRLVKSDEVDLYLSHQLVKAGKMQAEYALERQPKGNYVMVYGSSTDNNALIMREAQLAALKPAIDRGDVKIVAQQHAAEWTAENALKIVENALTQNANNIVAVISSNDGTAGGVVQALKAQNLTGKTVVTGMDAQLDALQRIAQGEQTMTVYKPIQPLAFAAVEAAIKLARRETVATTDKIKAVNREIPSILVEPKAIDKANLMDVVRDGYHKFEAVYANVPADQRPKNQ